MKYDVYFDCINGKCANLTLLGNNDNEVINKAKNILKDNEGGTAEIQAHFGNFYAIIEY